MRNKLLMIHQGTFRCRRYCTLYWPLWVIPLGSPRYEFCFLTRQAQMTADDRCIRPARVSRQVNTVVCMAFRWFYEVTTASAHRPKAPIRNTSSVTITLFDTSAHVCQPLAGTTSLLHGKAAACHLRFLFIHSYLPEPRSELCAVHIPVFRWEFNARSSACYND